MSGVQTLRPAQEAYTSRQGTPPLLNIRLPTATVFYTLFNSKNLHSTKYFSFELLSNDNAFLSYPPAPFSQRSLLARLPSHNTSYSDSAFIPKASRFHTSASNKRAVYVHQWHFDLELPRLKLLLCKLRLWVVVVETVIVRQAKKLEDLAMQYN